MFAKVAIFLAALAAAQATAILHGAALASTGVSSQTRQQDSLGNFAFRYDIADGAHVRSHAEVQSAPATIVAAPAVVKTYAAPAVVKTYASAPAVIAAPAPAVVTSYAAAPAVISHAAPYAHGPILAAAPVAGLRYGLGHGLLLNHGLGLAHGNLIL